MPLVRDPQKEYLERKKAEAEREALEKRLAKERRERFERACANWESNLIKSPHKALEAKANLTPEEKVRVLQTAIEVLNHNGDFDDKHGHSYRYYLTVTQKSLETANQFFAANTSVSVEAVMNGLSFCCFVNHNYEEPERGEYCHYFFAWRAGDSLDFFWNNLANVNNYCVANGCGFDGPIVYPEVKRRKEAEVVAREDANI